jgi:kynurenine formamidase
MTLIDLTHSFGQGIPVYPGDPVPRLEQIAHLGRDDFNAYCLCTGLHAGTHMDAPLHMVADGKLVCDLPVTRFIGRGRLIDARGRAMVTPDLLRGIRIGRGDMVLVLTGWDRHFHDEAYYRDYPEIAPDLARDLVQRGVAVLGLDTPSPDRPPFEVHKILLSHQVPIIENLTNLTALVGVSRFEVIALPAKLQSDAAPVRVIARVRDAATPQR